MADWFIVNVADAPALRHERGGTYIRFEPPDNRFRDFGINIHVLQPGEANGKYHAEDGQEDFLVLHGECIAIVENAEHPLRAWDFLHCPAGTEHIFVGAGTGPCAILMVGARGPGMGIRYTVNELAARYGASVTRETPDPTEAYADWPGEYVPTRLTWPLTG